jgi:hypothetical protein
MTLVSQYDTTWLVCRAILQVHYKKSTRELLRYIFFAATGHRRRTIVLSRAIIVNFHRIRLSKLLGDDN